MISENQKNQFSGLSDNQEFNRYYQKEIQPLLAAMDEQRLEALASYNRQKPVMYLFLGGAALLLTLAFLTANFWVLLIVFIAIYFSYSSLSKKIKSKERLLATHIREKISPLVLGFFGQNFSYQAKLSDEERERLLSLCRQSLLFTENFNEFSQYTSLVNGEHDGIPFFSTVLKLQDDKKKNARGKGHYMLFDGIMLGFEMDKICKSHVVIRGDNGMLGNLTQAFCFQIGGTKLNRIKLEDPLFEKKFEVFGNNPKEAHSLMTSALMKQLTNLADLYGDKSHPGSFGEELITNKIAYKVQCSFVGNTLLIFLPWEKFFKSLDFESINCQEPLTLHKECAIAQKNMAAIFGIIDGLKLGKKMASWHPHLVETEAPKL